jgi:alginate O-acetyltransferase complex protein AlgJ
VAEPEGPGEQTVASGRLALAHESWLPSEHPLYRPRHSGRQRTALVSAAVFFCVPLLLLCFGVSPGASENRQLASFPGLDRGWGFFAGLQTWATDHVPLRGMAVDASDSVSRGMFGEPPALGGRNLGPGAGPRVVAPSPGTRTDQANPGLGPTKFGYPAVIEGADGWFYLGDDVLARCRPEKPLAEVVAALTALRRAVEASGRTLVLVVPPDKSDVAQQRLPQRYVGKECSLAAAEQFWAGMEQVGHLDLRPWLWQEQERLGRPVYFAKDTHWTFEGGMVMVRRIAEYLRPGVTTGWRTSTQRTFERATDIPPLIGQQATETTDYLALAPDGRTTRSRDLFDRPDSEPVVLRPPATAEPIPGTVGTKIAMIGDSFTRFANPYFAAAFTDMTIMHIDYVEDRTVAATAAVVAADVVVLEIVERNLAGGVSAILDARVMDTLIGALAANPR